MTTDSPSPALAPRADPAADALPLVVIPTYCEAATLPALLEALLAGQPPVHVLVVDDASPDGTALAVRRHAAFDRRVFLLARPAKRGLGSAYRDGFQWALQRGYSPVIEMDADFSHDPADIPRLLQAIADGAEIAVGSRYLAHGRVEQWPWYRRWLSRGGGWYARLLTGLRGTDPTSGFKALRADALRRLDWSLIQCDGYAFQIAVNYFAGEAGLRLREIPIVFTERRDGESKLSAAVILEAVGYMLRLGARRLRRSLTVRSGRRSG